MSLEIIISYLAVLGIGGIIGGIIKHFLDKNREKSISSFNTKKEAYMNAIVIISGLADQTFAMMTSNSEGRDVNSIAVTNHLAHIHKEIAGARLIASNEVNELFAQIPSIVVSDGMKVISNTLKATKKQGDKYVVSLKQPEAQELAKWKEKVDALENNIILAIQKDLNIN